MIAEKYPVALVTAFIWTGFVCAISFMEAWLKFRAPGVTLPLGLGIGRLVFGALNKVEWVCAILIAATLFLGGKPWVTRESTIYVFVLLLLIEQTIWLLPILDARARCT